MKHKGYHGKANPDAPTGALDNFLILFLHSRAALENLPDSIVDGAVPAMGSLSALTPGAGTMAAADVFSAQGRPFDGSVRGSMRVIVGNDIGTGPGFKPEDAPRRRFPAVS